jgi:hypothetical protein
MAGDGNSSHPIWFPLDPGHIDSINHVAGSEDETYCIELLDDPSIEYKAAWYRIQDALYLKNPPGESWDGLEGGKIDFRPLHPSQWLFDYCTTGTEIIFNVKDDISSNCTSIENPAGCAKRFSPEENPASGHSDWYDELDYGVIYLKTSSLLNDDFYAHLVNHEVGHLFGLADGGPNWPPPPGPTPPTTAYPTPPTPTQNPWSCSPQSVMHSYGCTDWKWPTAADRQAVEVHIPNQGGSGGFGGGGKGLDF